MIQHIIFDLGGVLVNLNFDAFYEALADLLGTTRDQLYLNASNQIHTDYMCGKMDSDTYVKKIADLYRRNVSVDEFRQVWNIIIDGQKDDVVALIDRIPSSYHISLLSNTDPWHFGYSQKHYPVFRRFSEFFLSYEMQLLKPNQAIYEAVVRRLDTLPGTCVFIDDLAENIEAARACGMHGIHFRNAEQLQQELLSLGVMTNTKRTGST